MPPLHAILSLITAITSIVLGMFVLFLDARRATNRAFAYFSSVLAYWSFSEFIIRQSATLEAAQGWSRIIAFWPFVPVSMIHFALVATKRKLIHKRWFLCLLYFPVPLIIGTELFTDEMVTGAELTDWGYYFVFNMGIGFSISRFWAFLLNFCSLGICLHHGLITSEGRLRQASLLYASALSIPTLLGLFNIIILPLTSIGSLPLKSFALIWIVLVICFAIWKYNVFRPDQRAVAEKILQTMADPLLLLDPSLSVKYSNPASKILFENHQSDGVLNQPFFSILDPDYCDVKEIINRIKTHQTITSFEVGVLSPEGTIEGLLSVGYVFEKKKKLQGVVCIIHDITERKKAQRKLKRIQQDLVPSSRIAERAEVLSGLLHNIKNVLNSVGVSLSMVDQKLKDSKIEGLKKTVSLLSKHEGNLGQFFREDPRGEKLLPYLSALTDRVEGENENILQEISNLQKHFEHIKNVVEQRKNTSSHKFESIYLSDLVDDALLLKEADLQGHSIVVERQVDEGVVIQTDRHRMLQVLVNLVSNAIDSLKTVELDRRNLKIFSLISDESIKIQIEDSGEGIKAEDLEKIFTFGFTTKETGQGFGLHSCLRAVKNVGGMIEAVSDGPGKGAVFTLTFPLQIQSKEKNQESHGT